MTTVISVTIDGKPTLSIALSVGFEEMNPFDPTFAWGDVVQTFRKWYPETTIKSATMGFRRFTIPRPAPGEVDPPYEWQIANPDDPEGPPIQSPITVTASGFPTKEQGAYVPPTRVVRSSPLQFKTPPSSIVVLDSVVWKDIQSDALLFIDVQTDDKGKESTAAWWMWVLGVVGVVVAVYLVSRLLVPKEQFATSRSEQPTLPPRQTRWRMNGDQA